MKLGDLFDMALLQEMLETGYVKRQTHPTLPLAILLEALDTETHQTVPSLWPGKRVADFPDLRTLDAVAGALNRPNTEGYVLRFDSGERVKVKAEEYVRLGRPHGHRPAIGI